MAYKISFRKRASREYLTSLIWYKQRSLQAAENFIEAVNEALERLIINPKQYRNTYKQFYEIGLKRYPFAIVYFIDEEENQIVVVSIFHYKRNPRNKFRNNE